MLLALGPLCATAQSPSYVHYGVNEGLPSNKVYCALQDHRGFLWFGTDKGLARFDGARFQVFGVNEGLPDPEVLTLFEDSQHRLWISCFSHRPCYMENGKIITEKTESILAKVNIKSSLWSFSEDSDKNIWIAGKSPTVYIFDGKSLKVVDFVGSSAKIAHLGNTTLGLSTLGIMQQGYGMQYFVTEPAYNVASSNTQIAYSFTNQMLLLEWSNGKIVENDKVASVAGRLFPDTHNHFWLCTDTEGAISYDISNHTLSNPVRYLPGEHVNAMLEDRQGTIWFCTGGGGLLARSPGKAFTYSKTDGLITNNITAIARNQLKEVLAGDDAGNFYKIAGEHIQQTPLSKVAEMNRTRQIIPMLGDTCWIANDKGLFLQIKNTTQRIEPAGLLYFGGFKSILSMPDRLWYGNHYSLGFVLNSTKRPIQYLQERTTAVGQDGDGNVWAGHLDGLYSQADSFKFNWGDRFPALKSRIVAIQDAGEHKIWVATAEGGLSLGTVQNGLLLSLTQINQHIRDPVENIQSLFVEKRHGNRVWMATNKGVYGIDRDDFHVVHFDKNVGLADNDVNCVLVADDTLWAGSPGGLSYLPLLLQKSSADFGTFITRLHYQLGEKWVVKDLVDSLSSAHQVILPPDAAMTTLLLAGLNYQSQGNLEYRSITTKMMPPMLWWARHNLFSWIFSGFSNSSDTTVVQENSINYGVSLQSGAYKINVTAITAQGIESQYPDEWIIIVRPNWYGTIWFDLLIWSLIFYVIWRIIRARTAYKKLNHAVSDLQLQALQSQMNPHFVGNSINAIQQFFYPPNPGAASNYIEVFTRLLRRTITLSEKHFNNFSSELAYDRDYLQMIKLRFGEHFEYEIQGEKTVPKDLPFPSMLLQPILENATIHGLASEGVSKVVLQFFYTDNTLRCSITDNGKGIKSVPTRPLAKPREHKSKGLELLEKKVKAFNQLYEIELKLELLDLSELNPTATGTCAVITFNKKLGA